MVLELLYAHLALCALVLAGICLRWLRVHRYMFFVALFLPFWGVLLVLLLHFQVAFKADNARRIDVEKLKLESEVFRSIQVDDHRAAASTVPIEEALLINSARERRAIIMDVLNDNPKEYVAFLQKAGNNDDTEVVHYAVTAMVEIAKENDEQLQKLANRYRQSPDDPELLTDYADFLWSCLSRNLMQGQVEVINRVLFAELTEKKLSIRPTLEDYSRLVLNAMKQRNYTAAGAALDKMMDAYPNNEAVYLLKIEYLAELQRGEEIRQLIGEMQRSQMYLSAGAKEVLAFWGS